MATTKIRRVAAQQQQQRASVVCSPVYDELLCQDDEEEKHVPRAPSCMPQLLGRGVLALLLLMLLVHDFASNKRSQAEKENLMLQKAVLEKQAKLQLSWLEKVMQQRTALKIQFVESQGNLTRCQVNATAAAQELTALQQSHAELLADQARLAQADAALRAQHLDAYLVTTPQLDQLQTTGLVQAAREVAAPFANELLLAICDASSLSPQDLLAPWAQAVVRAGVRNALVVACDIVCLHKAREAGLPAVLHTVKEHDTPSRAVSKFRMLQALLDAGFAVLSTELDVLLLESPWQHLQRTTADIEVMAWHDDDGGFDAAARRGSRPAHGLLVSGLSPSVIFMRPNRACAGFVAAMLEALQQPAAGADATGAAAGGEAEAEAALLDQLLLSHQHTASVRAAVAPAAAGGAPGTRNWAVEPDAQSQQQGSDYAAPPEATAGSSVEQLTSTVGADLTGGPPPQQQQQQQQHLAVEAAAPGVATTGAARPLQRVVQLPFPPRLRVLAASKFITSEPLFAEPPQQRGLFLARVSPAAVYVIHSTHKAARMAAVLAWQQNGRSDLLAQQPDDLHASAGHSWINQLKWSVLHNH